MYTPREPNARPALDEAVGRPRTSFSLGVPTQASRSAFVLDCAPGSLSRSPADDSTEVASVRAPGLQANALATVATGEAEGEEPFDGGFDQY